MMPGVRRQEDVGPEPDLGVGSPAVVGEEILAFRRVRWIPVNVPAPPVGSGIAHRSRR
jgi:hypothetical protein